MDIRVQPTTSTDQSSTTPPPLPTPGTGGQEELPEEREARRDRRPAGCGGHGDRSRVVGVAPLSAMLVAVWALSGGGYFWPAWAMIGWGLCLVPVISRTIDGRSSHGHASR
ncbi:hypothetical protein SGUI_3131 [Serinicoccus hydrothermalis]|uniref:Uncharacterized protein n=1 Tax=Serinicoccus hydrothermalis TaxID=1758689 RepID=A0A1B1NGG5_9MICO|nr:2TM domain-containing protein [Serinicoccus hydrothermalis]ANS80527.1 hypothetical protein SGUI_3131 [Serinicoccus hydrothermalis]